MRFLLRTLLTAAVSFLIALGATLWADYTFYAMLRTRPLDIPTIAQWVLAPGELVTFIAILGDSGTEGQHRHCVIASSTAFYACLCFGLAMLIQCLIVAPSSAKSE